MHRCTTLFVAGLLTAGSSFAEDVGVAKAVVQADEGTCWARFKLGVAMERESLCELCEEWKPAWAAFRRGAELVAFPLAERIPTVQVQPWVKRTMAGLAVGAASSLSGDPQAHDPVRFVSHDERSFVGVLTPSDQLREISTMEQQLYQ